MALSKELEQLTERCRVLEKAGLGWMVRQTQTGWFVTAPPQPGKVLGEGTTVPFRDHGRAVINATKKLDRMGLSKAEALLRAREEVTSTPEPTRARPAEAPVSPARPVPPATFVAPESAPSPAKETNPVPSPKIEQVPAGARVVAKPHQTPIPLAQIEPRLDQKSPYFDVAMPVRPGGKIQYYKKIQGLNLSDGTKRYLCLGDESSCTDTYDNPVVVRIHLGNAHPSDAALLRRARVAQADAGAKKSVPAATSPAPGKPTAATRPPAPARPSSPTPASIARRAPAEPARTAPASPAATMRQRIEPATSPDRSATAAVPNDDAIRAVVGGITELARGYDYYRQLAAQGTQQYQDSIDALARQVSALEQQLIREQTSTRAAIIRAEAAEAKSEAAEAKLARLAATFSSIGVLLPS